MHGHHQAGGPEAIRTPPPAPSRRLLPQAVHRGSAPGRTRRGHARPRDGRRRGEPGPSARQHHGSAGDRQGNRSPGRLGRRDPIDYPIGARERPGWGTDGCSRPVLVRVQEGLGVVSPRGDPRRGPPDQCRAHLRRHPARGDFPRCPGPGSGRDHPKGLRKLAGVAGLSRFGPRQRSSMTDYRHDLSYGTFVTPVVRAAREPVELAVTADEAGLDLVTYQDHPYRPGLLDTWTLLSHVAARTEGIRLSGNVLSLPLRPPAVLARAAASLDILSGGRFELGLGAGAFWEGIAAMGGRKLTPAQSVEALREGITIIRELWNTDAPAGLRFDGEFYRISGAKRGPRPAHDIAIWIGAYKPKMLALTGAVGDGWVPTLEYLPDGVDSLPE